MGEEVSSIYQEAVDWWRQALQRSEPREGSSAVNAGVDGVMDVVQQKQLSALGAKEVTLSVGGARGEGTLKQALGLREFYFGNPSNETWKRYEVGRRDGGQGPIVVPPAGGLGESSKLAAAGNNGGTAQHKMHDVNHGLRKRKDEEPNNDEEDKKAEVGAHRAAGHA